MEVLYKYKRALGGMNFLARDIHVHVPTNMHSGSLSNTRDTCIFPLTTEANPSGGASMRPPYFRPLMFFPKVPKFLTHEFYFQIVGNHIYSVSCFKIFPDRPPWASHLQSSQCQATPFLGWAALHPPPHQNSCLPLNYM